MRSKKRLSRSSSRRESSRMVRPASAAATPTASAAVLGLHSRAVDQADLDSGRGEYVEEPGRVGRPGPGD
jgi:hypothetical protein